MIALLSLLLCGQVPSSGDGYIVPGVDAEQVTMIVNVWGEVRSPGAHHIPWNADLVAALSAAGGPTSQADLRDVRIVYRDFQSDYDLRAYLDGQGSTVPSMEPGVTVYIGRSGYEWWKEAIDFAYKIIVAVNVILVVTR